MPAKKSAPEYLVITSLKNKGILGARLLSRGEPYLPIDVTLGNKKLAMPEVGMIVMADMTDADAGVGTADILEIVTDAKELKRLRKDGTLPAEESYGEMVFIKETFDDKRAKTKSKKADGAEDAAEGGATTGPSEADPKTAEKKAKKGASPAVKPVATTSPSLNPSKITLEEQMHRLDAREGNAALDDI